MSIEHDVLVRDQGRCFKCGLIVQNSARSCHHRQLRSGGGSDTFENRITLCGSGTTGCHGEVHAGPVAAIAKGWIVSRYQEPERVPVQHWELGQVYLAADGRVVLASAVVGWTKTGHLITEADVERWAEEASEGR